MSKYPDELSHVIRSARQALKNVETTEQERALFLYDLVREVYDHVKFLVPPSEMKIAERDRIGSITDAALPQYGVSEEA